jgi:hypothetical protein
MQSTYNKDFSLDQICTLLGYYAVWNGNPLPMFWDNVPVPSSKGQEVRENETLVKDYHSTLCSTPE